MATDTAGDGIVASTATVADTQLQISAKVVTEEENEQREISFRIDEEEDITTLEPEAAKSASAAEDATSLRGARNSPPNCDRQKL